MYRRFYGYTDSELLKQLYHTLVRPHLDYACQVWDHACQVWDPHLAMDKAKLEKVYKNLPVDLHPADGMLAIKSCLNVFELSTL